MQCRKLTESQLGLKDEQVSQLRQLAVNQLAQKDEEVDRYRKIADEHVEQCLKLTESQLSQKDEEVDIMRNLAEHQTHEKVTASGLRPPKQIERNHCQNQGQSCIHGPMRLISCSLAVACAAACIFCASGGGS